jgi:regulator of protease activity HflC (stomatin/prohibitin superfamily)
MKKKRSFPVLIFIVILGIGAASAYAAHRVSPGFVAFLTLGAAVVLAFIVASAIQVADQWSKAVVLRLGKFRSLQGPGLF